MEGQRVSRKVGRVLVQSKLFVHLGHVGVVGVHVLPGLGIVLFVVLDEHEEVPKAPLLKHAHQILIDKKSKVKSKNC